MKKILFTAVLCLFATVGAMAEDVPKKPSFKGFETNGFWDNWELSVGGGPATALSSGDNYGARKERIGWELNASLTKWMHPVVGLRGQLAGGKFSNFARGGSEAVKWPYMYLHGDLMVNFSNWVGGYRADRAYYAVPYVGAGLLVSNWTDKVQEHTHKPAQKEFAVTAGLLNKFRVAEALDINLELKGVLAQSSINPVNYNGRFFGSLSATVGLTYRFVRRTFSRSNPYSAADLRLYQDAAEAAVAAASAAEASEARMSEELRRTRAEYEALKNAPKEVVYRSTGSPSAAAVVVYDIGVSALSAKARTRLDLLAANIKNGPKDAVYNITGHADSGTGSAALNKRLAEQRAKGVYDYLVKAGVPAGQLTYEGRGDVDIAPNPEASRVTIIQKK